MQPGRFSGNAVFFDCTVPTDGTGGETGGGKGASGRRNVEATDCTVSRGIGTEYSVGDRAGDGVFFVSGTRSESMFPGEYFVSIFATGLGGHCNPAPLLVTVASNFLLTVTSSFLLTVTSSFLLTVPSSFLLTVPSSFLLTVPSSFLLTVTSSFLLTVTSSFLLTVPSSFLLTVPSSFLLTVTSSFPPKVASTSSRCAGYQFFRF